MRDRPQVARIHAMLKTRAFTGVGNKRKAGVFEGSTNSKTPLYSSGMSYLLFIELIWLKGDKNAAKRNLHLIFVCD